MGLLNTMFIFKLFGKVFNGIQVKVKVTVFIVGISGCNTLAPDIEKSKCLVKSMPVMD